MKCWATIIGGFSDVHDCALGHGHTGDHISRDGERWAGPVAVLRG